jgi:hypothetical protein
MSTPAVTLHPDPQSPKPQTSTLDTVERIPLPWFVLRIIWIALRLILAYWLAWQARPFFYQRF